LNRGQRAIGKGREGDNCESEGKKAFDVHTPQSPTELALLTVTERKARAKIFRGHPSFRISPALRS
jgi:hypothetical protein